MALKFLKSQRKSDTGKKNITGPAFKKNINNIYFFFFIIYQEGGID